MSSIAAGTTTTTGYVVTSDSTGALVLKTGSSATTAVTIDTSQNVTFVGSQTLSGGTANGVLYLNGSKVATSGSALTWDTSTFLLDATPASSQANLRIKTDATGAVANAFFNIAGTDYFRISTESSQTGLRNLTNTPLYFSINNSEQMRLTSTGLGIGTSSPSAKLEVAGAAKITGTNLAIAPSTGTSAAYVVNTNTGGNFFVGIDNSTGGSFGAGAYGRVLYSGGAYPIVFLTNDTERMRLDASGNLAVGASSVPRGRVYINSGASANTLAIQSNTTGSYLEFADVVTPSWANSPKVGGINNDLVFSTSGSERARIDSSGNLLVGATSGYRITAYGANPDIVTYHNGANGTRGYITADNGAVYFGNTYSGSNVPLIFAQAGIGSSGIERARIDTSGTLITFQPNNIPNLRLDATRSSAGSEEICRIRYTAISPNSTTSWFIYADDSTAQRFSVRSNGGIANFSANDVNLSDRREKTNFSPAGSYLNKICAIPVQTFNYIDQNMEEDDGLTLGVVAQDVQAVAPELVMESNWAGKDAEPKMRLSVYQTDLQYALMKCIQEQQALIETLTQRITALEGR